MMTRRTIGCGLCPLRITLYGELLRWWFCPLCGCFNTIPIGREPMTTAGPDSPLPIGVYRGSAPDIGPVETYEAWLGQPVDYVLSFMADKPTWAQFEAGALQSGTNGPAGAAVAGDWAPQLGARTLMLATPACCNGTSWDDEAAGVNDGHWRALGRNLVAAGLAGAVLRIARELNGSWYPWKVTPTLATAHKNGWARIYGILRDAGVTGKIMWNPYITQGTFGPNSGAEAAYPGDAAVDVIGVDLYDGGYSPPGETIRTGSQQQATWNNFRDAWDGLTGWRQFAAGHGKPLAYPEWGLQLWLSGALYAGGGDNALFIREMAGWLKETNSWMHAFWEDPGVGVSDPDDMPQRRVAAPQSRAAFLAAFGTQP
jgi:hypothetical protein